MRHYSCDFRKRPDAAYWGIVFTIVYANVLFAGHRNPALQPAPDKEILTRGVVAIVIGVLVYAFLMVVLAAPDEEASAGDSITPKQGLIVMEGATVFHFVTDGIEAALGRARDAAGEREVKIGGSVSTVRQYLKAG